MHKIYKSSMMNKSKKRAENDLQSILKIHITLITITKNIYSTQKKQTLYA